VLHKLLEAAIVLVIVAVLLRVAIDLLRPMTPALLVIGSVVVIGRWLTTRRNYW
jgi:hypothetical protein